jgi:hypothetical protein
MLKFIVVGTLSGAGFTLQRTAAMQHAWSGREPQDDDLFSQRVYLTPVLTFKFRNCKFR